MAMMMSVCLLLLLLLSVFRGSGRGARGEALRRGAEQGKEGRKKAWAKQYFHFGEDFLIPMTQINQVYSSYFYLPQNLLEDVIRFFSFGHTVDKLPTLAQELHASSLEDLFGQYCAHLCFRRQCCPTSRGSMDVFANSTSGRFDLCLVLA